VRRFPAAQPSSATGSASARRWIAPLTSMLVVAVAVAGSGLLFPPVAALATAMQSGASRPPGGNFADPVIRQVDIDQPAVVRILTSERGTVDVQLCTRTVTVPLDGSTYDVLLTGSGSFVSASGDILTADHVVDPPNEVVIEYAAFDIANVLDNASNFDPGCRLPIPVTFDDVANGFLDNLLSPHAFNRKSVVWIGTAYSGPLSVSKIKQAPTQPATIVASSSFTEDDLALIHVAMTDTPSIQLDSSTEVQIEDHLTVIGFPGNGDVNDNATNFLTASINTAQVSAIKTGDNGSPLIQVGGNIEHGDSGGPVLNASGHIIGIVSFGGPDPQGETAFLRASNNALTMIQSAGIVTTPGAFQKQWSQAFSDYAATYAGHWHKAAQEMTALAASYPQFGGLTSYLQYAQTAAASEPLPKPRSTGPSMTLVVAVAVGILVLLVGGGAAILYFYLRARRRRRAPGTPTDGNSSPSGGYGVAGPPSYGVAYQPGYGPSGVYGPATGYPPPAPGYGPPPISMPLSGGQAWEGASAEAGACVNGHPLAPGQQMCPWCGAPRVASSMPGVGAPARAPAQES
jgi:S1-C subfamily serine protease